MKTVKKLVPAVKVLPAGEWKMGVRHVVMLLGVRANLMNDSVQLSAQDLAQRLKSQIKSQHSRSLGLIAVGHEVVGGVEVVRMVLAAEHGSERVFAITVSDWKQMYRSNGFNAVNHYGASAKLPRPVQQDLALSV